MPRLRAIYANHRKSGECASGSVDRSTANLGFAGKRPLPAVAALTPTKHHTARAVLHVHHAEVLATAGSADEADFLSFVRHNLLLNAWHQRRPPWIADSFSFGRSVTL